MKKAHPNLLLIDLITDDHSIDYLQEVEMSLGAGAAKHNLRRLHLPTEEIGPEDLRDADAILLSGSTKSAHQDFLWKERCHQVFDRIIESGKPALATCFSAQFLAIHLGGKVEENPRGIEFGPIQIKLTPAGGKFNLLREFEQEKHLFASHKDCITSLPDNCLLLAFNDNASVQAFSHGNILATQFHSDIPIQSARHLLTTRKQQYLAQSVIKSEEEFNRLHQKLEQATTESHQFLLNWLQMIVDKKN